jgi:hypothetical protein
MIALVGIGRQENRYVREWVEWHLKVGFDHIFIADNNRGNEERFEDVVGDYVEQGKVTVVYFRDRSAAQMEAYNSIYRMYGGEYEWMAFFDMDEFLCFRRGNLQTLTETGEDVVRVNWECYGDNGLVRYDERPVMERFSEPLKHPIFVQYVNHAENDHVKSIVRCGKGLRFTRNPHVPGDISPFRAYEENGGVVLHHYITKTAEEWKWRSLRGSGARTLAKWREIYAGRFWKYNEFTKEKENIMATERNVAIVHYNTPELTEATILSLRKHGGENYKVFIFDNSDERPWKKRMKGVKKFDNTKGQIVDFDKELAKYPHKISRHGVNGKCVYGSDKHMMSIQALFDLIPEGFLLMDSDILLKKEVDFMFQENQCVVGHIQEWVKSGNPYKIDRLVPMLCYINVPMCKSCGIQYWDGKRSWMLNGQTRGSWYDTGASFLEDVRSHRNGAHGKRIDIRPLMEHLKSGSWRNGDIKVQAEWLKKFEDLWR